MSKHRKLVRDKSAAAAQENTRVLSEKEYLAELVRNLQDAVNTFEAERTLERLAEIKELTIAIRMAMGLHAGELEDARRRLADKLGRFKKRLAITADRQDD